MFRQLLRKVATSLMAVVHGRGRSSETSCRDESNDANELGSRLAAGDWRNGQVGIEGHPIYISRVNVWLYDWESLQVTVELRHPAYPSQVERFDVYRIR